MKSLLKRGALLALLAAGCDSGMSDQPRHEPLEASDFFDDRKSAREPVAGTVARGFLREDGLLHAGKIGSRTAEVFPFPVDRAVLERGRERYGIFCAPCHDYVGTGQGRIVQRGFRPPPSYHLDRLRQAPPGHFFDVMTNGFGAMPDYAAQIPARDRWAIAAYIRALQRSQHARAEDLPEEERRRLEGRAP